MKKLPVGRKPEILWDVLFFMFTLISYVLRRMCFMQRSLFLGFWFTCSLKIEANSNACLFKGVPVVSLESAERPNFFLAISGRGPLHLEHWSQDADFSTRATFIQHQGLFQPGHTSFELFSQPGTFLTLTHTSAQPQRYDTSDTFRTSSSFTLEGQTPIRA